MDLDIFRQAQAVVSRTGVRGWWEKAELSDEQWAAVNAAIDDPDISDRAIQHVMGQWGCDVTVGQIGHYRRKCRG